MADNRYIKRHSYNRLQEPKGLSSMTESMIIFKVIPTPWLFKATIAYVGICFTGSTQKNSIKTESLQVHSNCKHLFFSLLSLQWNQLSITSLSYQSDSFKYVLRSTFFHTGCTCFHLFFLLLSSGTQIFGLSSFPTILCSLASWNFSS